MPLYLPCCQRAWHVIMCWYYTWESRWHVFLFGLSIIFTQKVRITGFEQKRKKDDLHWKGTLWLGSWQPTSPPWAHTVGEGRKVLRLLPCLQSLGKQFLFFKLTLEYSAYSFNVHNNTLHSHLAGEETGVRFLPPSGSACSDGLCLR